MGEVFQSKFFIPGMLRILNKGEIAVHWFYASLVVSLALVNNSVIMNRLGEFSS